MDETFITTSPYLLDSLFVVGGSTKDEAKFKTDIDQFIRVAYEHYKPIGVGMTAQSYIPATGTTNLSGIVSAEDTPNFGKNFVTAIAQQRFWERT